MPVSSPPYPFPELYAGHAERYHRVEQHQALVEQLLTDLRYEGVLLTEPANFVWFTAGGDWRNLETVDQPPVAVFISRGHRLLLATQTLADELFEQEIPGLGFQLKLRPEGESFVELLDEVCRGRRVCSDSGFGRTRPIAPHMDAFRQSPQPQRLPAIIELAQLTEQALQDVAGSLTPGLTAPLIAGRVAAACLERGLTVIGLNVLTDPVCPQHSQACRTSESLAERACLQVLTRRRGWHHLSRWNVRLATDAGADQTDWQACQFAQAELISRLQADLGTATTECLPTPSADRQQAIQQRVWQLGYRHPERMLNPDTDAPLLPGLCYYLETRIGPWTCGGTYRCGEDQLLPAWWGTAPQLGTEVTIAAESASASPDSVTSQERPFPWISMPNPVERSGKEVWVPECLLLSGGGT